MDPTATNRHREARLRALDDSAYVDLLLFMRRWVHPTYAEDVVGEVLLVVWRRLDDVPADLSAARAWTFGVTHETLQDACRRSAGRTRSPYASPKRLPLLPAPTRPLMPPPTGSTSPPPGPG